MAEIRLDVDKAKRVIAQILRDEQKLLPEPATALAATICRRLLASMPSPAHRSKEDYRVIPPWPVVGGDFAFAVAEKLAVSKNDPALFPEELWKLVYDRSRELPG